MFQASQTTFCSVKIALFMNGIKPAEYLYKTLMGEIYWARFFFSVALCSASRPAISCSFEQPLTRTHALFRRRFARSKPSNYSHLMSAFSATPCLRSSRKVQGINRLVALFYGSQTIKGDVQPISFAFMTASRD